MFYAESLLQTRVKSLVPSPYNVEAHIDLLTDTVKIMVFLYGNHIGSVSVEYGGLNSSSLEEKLLDFINLANFQI